MSEQWVLYYYQGELGESFDTPNAFSIPRLNGSPSLSLRELLAYFPSPSTNSLIFRFRVPDDEHGYLWEDVSSDVDPLPRQRTGEIFMKVLRLDDESVSKRRLFLKRKSKLQLMSYNGAPSNPSSQGMKASSSRRDDAATMSSPKEPPKKPEKPSSKNTTPIREEPSILEFEAASSGTAFHEEEDLVDFGEFVQSKGHSPISSSTNLESLSLDRNELARHREDDVRQKVEAALNFKLEVLSYRTDANYELFHFWQMDEQAKRESEEFEAAKAKHDQRLTVFVCNYDILNEILIGVGLQWIGKEECSKSAIYDARTELIYSWSIMNSS